MISCGSDSEVKRMTGIALSSGVAQWSAQFIAVDFGHIHVTHVIAGLRSFEVQKPHTILGDGHDIAGLLEDVFELFGLSSAVLNYQYFDGAVALQAAAVSEISAYHDLSLPCRNWSAIVTILTGVCLIAASNLLLAADALLPHRYQVQSGCACAAERIRWHRRDSFKTRTYIAPPAPLARPAYRERQNFLI
jgi:hypothetical protein